MPDNTLENNQVKFASSLIAAIRKLSLYPAKHPAVVYSIKDLYTQLQEIFSIKNTLSMSLSSDNQILIEGKPATKGSKMMEDLALYFKKMEIETLTLNSGLSDKELEAFIRILLIDPDKLKKLGDLSKVFLQNDIKHIKIAQFSYIKVQKGKMAIEVDDKKKRLLEGLSARVKDYSRGKITNPPDIQNLEMDIIKAVSEEFKEKKKISSATKEIMKRFLFKSEDKEGIFVKIKDVLISSGYPPAEAGRLIDKIKGIISKKAKTTKGSGLRGGGTKGAGAKGVGAKEVERLRIENEQLKLQIEQLSRAGIGKSADIIKSEIDTVKVQNEELRFKVAHLEKEIDSKAADYKGLEIKYRTTNQEKERIDNIVHHMAEGLVVVDPHGKIVMLNPVAEKLLNISKKDVGIHMSKTIKDEHLLTIVKNIKPDQDGMSHKDIEFLSPDESTKRILRTSSAVIEDHNGKTVGMVTTLNDITRQKEIERMKNDFVASVSHELRTPMANIHQNISLLAEGLAGGLNETQKKFLDITQRNIQRLKRLINDLLDSAAIEAGKLRLKFTKSHINERINNVVAFLTAWAATKNIIIETELFSGSESLEMDNDRIEQILTNLISNAIKFTPEGGKIFVSARKREATKDMPQGGIEISVKDTGQGIAPENIEKVFDKFERAGAVNSGVGGTGLGLSICKEIARLHGGLIWAESKVGEGSKFSFLLPFGEHEAPTETKAKQ